MAELPFDPEIIDWDNFEYPEPKAADLSLGTVVRQKSGALYVVGDLNLQGDPIAFVLPRAKKRIRRNQTIVDIQSGGTVDENDIIPFTDEHGIVRNKLPFSREQFLGAARRGISKATRRRKGKLSPELGVEIMQHLEREALITQWPEPRTTRSSRRIRPQ